MVLACHEISKSYGEEEILRNVSFHIEENEKAAIVGINGAGKSTLLKILIGEISPDEGEVSFAKDKTVGYLAQHLDPDSERTIYEEILSAKQEILDMEQSLRQMENEMNRLSGAALEAHLEKYHKLSEMFSQMDGYAYQSEVVGILNGLGFAEEDFRRPLKELSGGQKTRVALGKLLVSKPDILFLDEPTNHLDIMSITWLETFLLNYHGTVVIVAHDRYFLDKIVTRVIELEHHKATVFLGNYSTYAEKKKELRVAQRNAYLNQQREIKHQEEVITKLKQFNREKSIKRAESREKALEKIERIEKPAEEMSRMKLTLEPLQESGKDVLTVEHLSKSFDALELFSDLNFSIYRGERVALIGGNGTGKTTLLKILCQQISADGGLLKLGAKVQVGYYDQEHQGLEPEHTLVDEIRETYPELTNTQIRNTLAAFLFTEEDVFKRIRDLSGGEKGRVAMAKLMLSGANFLVLDEPTNHLDMVSKEILEEVLCGYTGTVFYVSHDRYFINQTATRILHLNGKRLTNYIGNYDYYREKRDILEKDILAAEAQAETESEGKTDWEKQKQDRAAKRKKENAIAAIEDEIATLEQEIADLEAELLNPEIASSSGELNRISGEMEEKKEALEHAYSDWEELASDL